MEENIKVKIIQTYYDLEKEKDIECGKIRWLTEKRAKELNNKNLIRILQIIRKGAKYE